uniref:ATP synthase F0 subunit 8 n=1 Tax=Hyocrinidae sp. TaxID=3078845 RepID=A0AA96MP37_9ECHI|nr:ATP synthase F0 subunit 8 [Hyocrinidae sp.]
MPQLDLFWWGLNFSFCWFFLLIYFIYLTNLSFVSLFYLSSYNVFNNSSFVNSFIWLW